MSLFRASPFFLDFADNLRFCSAQATGQPKQTEAEAAPAKNDAEIDIDVEDEE